MMKGGHPVGAIYSPDELEDAPSPVQMDEVWGSCLIIAVLVCLTL
jgi:hypothetical protein